MFTKLAMTSSKSSYFDLSKSYNFLAIFFTYSIMKIVKGRFAICGIILPQVIWCKWMYYLS